MNKQFFRKVLLVSRVVPAPTACDLSQPGLQGVEEARNTLFILLGQPRPQDATNRLFETKPPIEVHH